MIDLGQLSIEARCDYWRKKQEELAELKQKYIQLLEKNERLDIEILEKEKD